MVEFADIVYQIVIWLFLLYSAAVFLIYAWIGIYAYGAVLNYKSQNTFTDYNLVVTNKNALGFSLIAPAYNEGMTIVENVRSLLSLYYHDLEIIIVNDGSKDDSIEKLIRAYDLEKVSFYIEHRIETKAVKAVYKSKNIAFKKLIVVDKENGGKADALNVGVNISSRDYIVCIDVDCILEQDALLKLAKPFLEQSDKRVIACGGVIRLANNCRVDNGKITDVNLPETWLGRTQALEYIRAFVLGRMAWSRASGLILISGAFGAFDKEIVLACGGYDRNTVGEDMELVVRMRRYMEEQKSPYQVVNIPDPLCWTEAPESKEVLQKQRNRWMRGTMETLWKHRKLMFNPKYGKFGMVSLPYWFFFEFLGPIVEFLGYFVFILFWVLGIIDWSFFFALFALVISSGILYSIYAILVDLVGYQVYTKRKDLSKLLMTAVLEPFYFHPMVVKAGVQGVVDYFKNQHTWGEMTRQGFTKFAKDEPWYNRVLLYLTGVIKRYTPVAVLFLCMYLLTIGIERWWYGNSFNQLLDATIGLPLFLDNLWIGFQLVLGIGVFYILGSLINEYFASLIVKLSFGLLIVMQFVLFLYFSESRNLLGADILYYSTEEMEQILKSSGMMSFMNIGFFLLLLFIVAIPFWFINKIQVKKAYIGICLLFIGVLTLFLPIETIKSKGSKVFDEFERNAAQSKWGYFIKSNFTNYLHESPQLMAIIDGNLSEEIESTSLFPFLRTDDSKDFLGSYFDKSAVTPNLVLVIVEGLGSAYSSANGYIGDFTPFINSLSEKSLYWTSNLSSSGRTFSVLPTILGSLPFGTNGFLEEPVMANHFNLFNILNHNGFQTGFYYGGEADFDNMQSYLTFSKVDLIVDEDSYSATFKKLPGNNGESWGFEDQAVFTNYLETQKVIDKPYFNVLLTLSTHSPFMINNKEYYESMFDRRLLEDDLTVDNKKWAKENRKQLVSVLNLDDALSKFFEAYQKRSDFNNTIFIITGDHAMPEVPLQTKIDRYHVPLLIYSPLLKSNRVFKNTVSHFDLAPSLLAFYRDNYNVKLPSDIAWIGKGLDVGGSNRSNGVSMMQSKNQLIDFVHGNYHLVDNDLFLLDNNLQEELIQDDSAKEMMKDRFEKFKRANKVFVGQQKVIPDSIYQAYFNTAIPRP